MGTISRDITWEIVQKWSMGSGPNWHRIVKSNMLYTKS